MSPLPSYGDLLSVRPEVLDEQGLVDMIDLAGLRTDSLRGLAAQVPSSRTIADPGAFFEITYPTEDARAVLGALSRRATEPEGSAGTILLSGHFGLGKSHLLLAAHHALSAPGAAAEWAKRWKLGAMPFPSGARVVTRNFIDRTDEHLWTVLLEAFGQDGADVATYVDGERIRGLLDERPTFLILDELERWFDALPERLRGPNLAFIQAVTEVAATDPRLTLLTSVLGEKAEPGETIRRTKPLELSFRSTADRERVIRFRLFSGIDQDLPDACGSVVDAYLEGYAQAGLQALDVYRERMRATYPFTPEFLDILTRKVPDLGGFQATRGTLRFLAKVVRRTHARRAMVSSQDLPLDDATVADDLARLDRSSGGEVVRRALGDNWDAVPDELAHKASLFSTLVFYSVADPTHSGATEDEILRSVLDPGENPNHVKDDLRRLKDVAYNLHVEDGRYVFRARENPQARINAVARSPRVTEDACRQVALGVLATAWGDKPRTALHTGDIEATGRALKALGSARHKFVVSTRSLSRSPDDRLRLQNLDARRNLVLLVEPRIETTRNDAVYDFVADDEVRRSARRIEACRLLLEGSPAADARAVYDQVRRHEESRIAQSAADAFGVYVAWSRAGATGSTVDGSWFELHPIDEFSASRFAEALRREHANPGVAEYAVRNLWSGYVGRPVRQLIDHFESTPGTMVPFDAALLPNAVRTLVKARVFGLEDAAANRYGDPSNLSDAALRECTIILAPTIAPEPEPVERVIHPFVTGRYDRDRKNVTIEWELPPDAGSWQTLVKRYTAHQGWSPRDVVNVGYDETREDHRYLGDGTRCVDPPLGEPALKPGARYHYYIFLVSEYGTPNATAVLSQRIDMPIPTEDTTVEPDRVSIPAQPGLDELTTEVEATLMRGAMKADSRARRVRIEIEGITGMQSVLAAEARPDRFGASGGAEVEGRIVYTLRGEWSRTEVTELVARAPRIAGAQYRVVIRLSDD
jgi:hypothetical protein